MATVPYYFNSYDTGEDWLSLPQYMVDNNLFNFAATTTDTDVELLDGNTCPGTDLGTITKVEIRGYIKYINIPGGAIKFRAVYGGTNDGILSNEYVSTVSPDWTNYHDITSHLQAPYPWTWSDVQILDCDVVASLGGKENIYCAKVEIRVTYTVAGPSDCNNPGEIALNATNYGDELFVQTTNYGNELRQYSTCS